MAVYEYKCPDCGYTCEVKAKMTDIVVALCDCGHEMLRQVSAPIRTPEKWR